MIDYLRSYPDDNVSKSPVIAPDFELSEHASRLVAPKFRREGRIVDYTDFSPSLGGWKFSSPGSNIFISPTQSAVGASSVRINATATVAPYIQRRMPRSSSQRVGLEAWIFATLANLEVDFQILIYKGTFYYDFTYRFRFTDGYLRYMNSSGTFTSLGNIPELSELNTWINFKSVVDGEGGQYVRVMINDTKIDNIDNPHPVPISNGNGLRGKILMAGVDQVNPFDGFIDAPLITINEY